MDATPPPPARPPVSTPLSWGYRGVFALLAVMFVGAAVPCLLELTGVVERDALLRGASDLERWLVVGLTLWAVPFAWTGLVHGRLTLDGETIEHLRLGPWCRTGRLPLAAVRRWGHGSYSRQGRRFHELVLELEGGEVRTLHLERYRDGGQFVAGLQARLGAPAPTEVGLQGVKLS